MRIVVGIRAGTIIICTMLIVTLVFLAIVLAKNEASLAAFSERALNFTHDIQTKYQSNSCSYFVSIRVLDDMTMDAITSALVEFKTPLTGNISNKTDPDGMTLVTFTLQTSRIGPMEDQHTGQEQQINCIKTLLSQGYSIEVSKEGYAGQGIGTIS